MKQFWKSMLRSPSGVIGLIILWTFVGSFNFEEIFRQIRAPARDAVASSMKRWLGVLEREVALAVDAGELPAGTEPADVAFQLNALAAAASYGFQLSRDTEVFARARRSMRRALGA